jgi:putative hydrolase of the HAD superfamily
VDAAKFHAAQATGRRAGFPRSLRSPAVPTLPDRIDAVLLDVGGVFHLPDHDRIVAAMARAGVRVDPTDLDRAHYAGVRALTDFHEGDREIWLAYNRGYAHALGAADRVEQVAEILLNEFTTGGVWTRVVPGSAAALRALQDTGVRLAVVSNADGSVEAQLAADGIGQVGPGPGVPMDAICDSSVVGVAKPDPRIFVIALERCGVDPAHAIHVGDTPAADVAGAVAAGVTPVLVDPHGDHPDIDVVRVGSLADVVPLVASRRGAAA